MKYFYANLAFFLSLVFANAQAATQQPLIEAHELTDALMAHPELQIIDIRSPEDYAAGHIPQALSAPYGQWRGPANNPGQLADDAYFQELLRTLGLTGQQPIVVYSSGADETDFGAAARVYWTLKYLGLTDLSVLNGGFKQWQQAISTQAPTVQASQLVVQSNPKLVILQDELLDKITRQDTTYQLLDARPPIFYQGQAKAPTASTGGTIATAQNTPFGQWFNQDDTRIRPT
ncbi:MAG: rhodanese-like domain-containing protein, partial [Pseudomonas sp.]|nr:rhodanese-like domain-containing protein [Pseudomonas sp.]